MPWLLRDRAVLASLETAAESTDAPPTAAMRDTALKEIRAIDADWDAWQHLRANDLEQLNRKLAAAGLRPITVPAGADLRPVAADTGEDLP